MSGGLAGEGVGAEDGCGVIKQQRKAEKRKSM